MAEDRDKAEEGICIVSFDGGGPGSMSQLRILEEFMLRLAFKPDVEVEELHPADYFDLMGGVGFGGLVALLLGRLRMTTSRAMEELAAIGAETFHKGDCMATPDVKMARLRQAIESMLERHGHAVDIKLRDSSDNRCKVVLFAATTAVMDHCHPFRTYRSRQKCPDCTFVDAACATIAQPEYFSSVAIGPRLRVQYFAGIPHGFDNPMRRVLKEAQLTFGEQKLVSLVLSLGSGPRPRLSDPDHHVTRLCRIQCNGVAGDLQDQLQEVGEYLRLNVDRDMESVELDAWHELGSIESYTNVYLEMNTITNYIDRASQWLLQRSGSVTLGQLSGTSTGSIVKFHSDTLKHYLTMEFKQMHDVVQELGIERITLVDAIGNHIPIPLQFCLSYTMLLDVIGVYFKHQKAPGHDFVEKGEYRLLQGTRKSIVGPMEWSSIEKVGLKVEMSIVLHTRNQDEATCPTCCTRFEGSAVNEWAQCLSCSGQFHIEFQVQAGAYVQTDNTNQFEGKPLIESSVSISAMSELRSREPMKREHRQFRLISVIKLLETQHAYNRGVKRKIEELLTPGFYMNHHGLNTFKRKRKLTLEYQKSVRKGIPMDANTSTCAEIVGISITERFHLLGNAESRACGSPQLFQVQITPARPEAPRNVHDLTNEISTAGGPPSPDEEGNLGIRDPMGYFDFISEDRLAFNQWSALHEDPFIPSWDDSDSDSDHRHSITVVPTAPEDLPITQHHPVVPSTGGQHPGGKSPGTELTTSVFGYKGPLKAPSPSLLAEIERMDIRIAITGLAGHEHLHHDQPEQTDPEQGSVQSPVAVTVPDSAEQHSDRSGGDDSNRAGIAFNPGTSSGSLVASDNASDNPSISRSGQRNSKRTHKGVPTEEEKKRPEYQARKYKCSHPECGARFQRSDNRERHIKTVHEPKLDWICPVHGCAKRCKRENNGMQHLQMEHDSACPGCDIKFSHAKDLYNHLITPEHLYS